MTWNPTTGCTPVSSGCDHCYAETLSQRFLRRVYLRRLPVVDTPETREDPFAVRLWPERLSQPYRWKRRALVFVNSMSDLFHVDVPDTFVQQVFATMLDANQHIYQVLTKRPARAAKSVYRIIRKMNLKRLPRHIWIGTSVENQTVAYRLRHLMSIPASVRFVSCEPLIGPLEIERELDTGNIHWVIVGGESGPGHRRMKPRWAAALRDQCIARAVPFFFKQWGGRTPKAGGRRLDGRKWNQMPTRARIQIESL